MEAWNLDNEEAVLFHQVNTVNVYKLQILDKYQKEEPAYVFHTTTAEQRVERFVMFLDIRRLL